MTRARIFFLLLTLLFVGGVGYAISLFARGYRFDTKTLSFKPEGVFVITSSPNGAQIFIDGTLKSATDETLSLLPDTYDIELRKEGYLTWKKSITIKKEEVTKVETHLFPAAPTLSPLTFTGAVKPVLSGDSTKLAFGVPGGTKADPEKVGIWVMEMADLPIGFSRDPRKITDLDPKDTMWRWSPDGRSLLLTSPLGFILLDTGEVTLKGDLIPLTSTKLAETLATWQKEEAKIKQAEAKKLPDKFAELLKAETLTLSPDETKVLYTASEDFTLPENLLRELPGSSTQKQERDVKKGKTYVYDLKEDRNFAISDQSFTTSMKIFEQASASAQEAIKQEVKTTTKVKLPLAPREAGGEVGQPLTSIYWLPTSNHIMIAEAGKIVVADYDGTNAHTLYAGPYEAPYALPFPNSTRILMLTNFGAGAETPGNLYSIGLK